jgi:hypothetical protein
MDRGIKQTIGDKYGTARQYSTSTILRIRYTVCVAFHNSIFHSKATEAVTLLSVIRVVVSLTKLSAPMPTEPKIGKIFVIRHL